MTTNGGWWDGNSIPLIPDQPGTAEPTIPCTCGVLCIYIPPGTYIDIVCPVHGRVRYYGTGVTCS